jgi:ribosomal protein S18 acetylase RimI-like enzyme
MPAVTTRPADSTDTTFLFALFAESGYVPAVLAQFDRQLLHMQFAAQRAAYAAHFPHAAYEIVLVDGEPAGQVRWAELDDEIRIVDVAMLARFRRQGAATAVYRRLLEHAHARGKPVRASVERSNGVSLSFHHRLGFIVEGETETHLLLTAPAPGR